jgi:hypothetical protein
MTDIIVDSESGSQSPSIVVAGDAATFTNTLTASGEAYDLTAKTVTATVRREEGSQIPIDDDLEDISVSIADADAGDVVWIMTAAMSALLAPPNTSSLTATVPYVCIYKVVEDEVQSLPMRFLVRIGI